MNRLPPLMQQAASPRSPASSQPTVALEFGQIQCDARHATPHALFVPMHYEPNYAYPLLVWLHGPGDDERQLQRIMPLVSLRNYVAIGPRAPGKIPGSRGHDWRQEEADIDVAETSIFNCIDLISARFHVAPHRIFVAGFGSGGTMAFRIGLRNPQRFAGALSLGGAFPSGHMPLARLTHARKLPLFIAHGRDAEHYSIDRSCDELRLFHSAGLSVTLRQYPCGDELTTHMLSDMDRWMMELVTGVDQGSSADTPSFGNEYN
jgi:phospholipase/carboxylesterase